MVQSAHSLQRIEALINTFGIETLFKIKVMLETK